MNKRIQCLLFTALIAVSYAGVPIIKIAPGNSVKPGEDVTISCVVDDYKAGDLIYWKKRQGLADTGASDSQIATNTLLAKAFGDTGRYAIDVQEGNNNQMTFLLNIKGAVAEDSGYIECEHKGSAVDSLTVISPVKKLTLYGMKDNVTSGSPIVTYRDNEELAFSEGENYFFRCLAEGSNPKPDLRVTVGEDNIDDKFTSTSTKQVSSEGVEGLKTISTTAMTTTHSALTITHEQNGLDLRCSANVADSEPISTSIKILLHFPPTIRKCGKIMRVPRNRAYFHIVCIVKAHPAVYMDSISWHFFRKDKTNITLHDTEEYGNCRVDVRETKKADEHEVHLIIERVGLPYFKNYYLRASNEMGDVEHKISLRRDKTGEAKGAAGSISSSLAPLLIAASVCLLGRV